MAGAGGLKDSCFVKVPLPVVAGPSVLPLLRYIDFHGTLSLDGALKGGLSWAEGNSSMFPSPWHLSTSLPLCLALLLTRPVMPCSSSLRSPSKVSQKYNI